MMRKQPALAKRGGNPNNSTYVAALNNKKLSRFDSRNDHLCILTYGIIYW